jgi:hypothetical protein
MKRSRFTEEQILLVFRSPYRNDSRSPGCFSVYAHTEIVNARSRFPRFTTAVPIQYMPTNGKRPGMQSSDETPRNVKDLSNHFVLTKVSRNPRNINREAQRGNRWVGKREQR